MMKRYCKQCEKETKFTMLIDSCPDKCSVCGFPYYFTTRLDGLEQYKKLMKDGYLEGYWIVHS
jgi:hypothetical protein